MAPSLTLQPRYQQTWRIEAAKQAKPTGNYFNTIKNSPRLAQEFNLLMTLLQWVRGWKLSRLQQERVVQQLMSYFMKNGTIRPLLNPNVLRNQIRLRHSHTSIDPNLPPQTVPPPALTPPPPPSKAEILTTIAGTILGFIGEGILV